MLKTRVTISGRVCEVGTINFADGLWLVPGWRQLAGGWRKPAGLIRIDTLSH